MNNINSLLLEFLTNITTSSRDRETNNFTEYLVCFFILSQLKFCTNPRKPTPIHDVIADVAEVCEGSRLLISVLNKLGCATSPDIQDRFVTHHAMVQCQSNIWEHISKNTFTIASVENILICFRIMQLFIAETNRGAIMEQHFNCYSQILSIWCFHLHTPFLKPLYRLRSISNQYLQTQGSKQPRTVEVHTTSLVKNDKVQTSQVQ